MVGSVSSHLRLSWVALAAIVGMLTVAGEASACGTSGEAEVTRSCCVVRPMPSCGCCDSPTAGVAEAAQPQKALPAPVGAAAVAPPAGACECRPGEPASPAPRPESRTPEHRPDHIGDLAAQPVPAARPAALLARRLVPGESPSGVPLYALTSRLRF